MNITLKNVPDPVYQVMKRPAKRNGRSLNAELIRALETEAELAERQERMTQWRKEADEFVASLPLMDDSTPIIRRERERR